MTSNAPESVEMELFFGTESVGSFLVPRRGAGQFTPYYPLTFTPEEAGSYLVRSDLSEIDVEFRVERREDVNMLQVGETLPAFVTPTFEAASGVDPICTRAEPCPFHTISLDEALGNSKPTALLVATPEFCLTDVCGPSVEFLIAEGAQRQDSWNLIHAEVFASPRDLDGSGGLPELAPLLKHLELVVEPVLYIAGADNVLTDVRQYAIDSDEFAEAFGSVDGSR